MKIRQLIFYFGVQTIVSNWILSTGFWDDSKEWIDGETWID